MYTFQLAYKHYESENKAILYFGRYSWLKSWLTNADVKYFSK